MGYSLLYCVGCSLTLYDALLVHMWLHLWHLNIWVLDIWGIGFWSVGLLGCELLFFLTGYWASFEWYSHCILKLVTHTFPCEYVYHQHSLIKYPCLQPRSAVIKMCMHVVILLNRETIIFRSFCGPWCCSARLEVSCFHLFVHAANTFF